MFKTGTMFVNERKETNLSDNSINLLSFTKQKCLGNKEFNYFQNVE